MVCFHVCFQMCCLWRLIVTMLAFVGLFSTVSPKMPFGNHTNRGISTHITFVPFIFVMCQHVHLNITSLVRGVFTVIAFVGLYSCMSQHVCVEITLLNACIIANVTLVRFFTTVRHDMAFHVTTVIWSVVTVVAFFRLFAFDMLCFHVFP